MVNINLEFIKKYFPQLKRFIARLRIGEIRLMADKHHLSVDTDKVLECFHSLFTIVAFGKIHNRFDIDIPIEYVEEAVEWLGCQSIKDTDILMMRMDMIDDLDVTDKALDVLYRVLADVLEEV